MANVTLKHLFNHGVASDEWLKRHSAVAANPLYLLYANVCNASARLCLWAAQVPLLAIKRLPPPFHNVSVQEFYSVQWLDDMQHIRSAHYKVMFAMARIVDAFRLAIEFGSLGNFGGCRNSQCTKEKHRPDCNCEK